MGEDESERKVFLVCVFVNGNSSRAHLMRFIFFHEQYIEF